MKLIPKVVFRTPLFPMNGSIDKVAMDEAIYLSSPVLYKELLKNNISSIETTKKEKRKLDSSLYKYQSRASNRCTPFGLFAGLGVSEFGQQNEILISQNLFESLERKTRLDMNVLCRLARMIEKNEKINPYLTYFKSSTIYRVGESYRYIEFTYRNNRRFYKISKVDYSEFLEFILDNAKSGLKINELIGLLINEGINQTDAEVFVHEIIDAQILTSQFEPNVIGNDFFNVLNNHLCQIFDESQSKEVKNILDIFIKIKGLIADLDNGVLNPIKKYTEVFDELKIIFPELNETNLFQVDSYRITRPFSAISEHIRTKVEECLTFLNKITPPDSNTNLEQFIAKFNERFEGQEVPLLFLMDKETGIGYPNKDTNGINELVNDLVFLPPAENNDIKWTNLQSCLLGLITKSLKNNQKVIEVSEDDFKTVDFSKSRLGLSLPVLYSVIDAGENKIVFKGASGTSAVNMIGRFAAGNECILSIINEITEHEQNLMPEKIIAEIAHLPEDRTGNVIARQKFRKYEIPYLARSTAEENFQIAPDDLMISVKSNRIILRSKQLNKEIIPRLGNAHNFSTGSLAVYHFLCDLQYQYIEKRGVYFTWGIHYNLFSFLPRIEFKGSVLSPAIWKLDRTDINRLNQEYNSQDQKLIILNEIINKLELPAKFLVIEGDNDLLIDLNNINSVNAFFDLIKNKSSVILQEFLFNPDSSLIKDKKGYSYTNECLSFALNSTKRENEEIPKIANYSRERIYPLGSEWIYFKVYCGIMTADRILSDEIKAVTNQLLKKGAIKNWFFIRYADPDFHLRIRFELVNKENIFSVVGLIHDHLAPLLRENIITKIQTDSYIKEMERYGEATIEHAESIFFFDSEFVLGTLTLLGPESGSKIRWKIAIRSVDEFLDNFDLSISEKHEFVKLLSVKYFNEHGGGKQLKITLDNKFRNLRKELEDVLDRSRDGEKEYIEIINLLNERSEKTKRIAQTLIHLKKDNKLELSLESLLSSYLHMNLDRLFMGRNRTNEMVVYDLLSRHYKSTLAKQKSYNIRETKLE